MPISPEALELENRSIGVDGEPTMAAAYRIPKGQWDSGERDREIGLHLMFLAWFGIVEPGHITGFSDTDGEKRELQQVLNEMHSFFEPLIHNDAEILYAFGLAADLFGYMFDDAPTWEYRAEEYKRLYRQLRPDGLDPTIFQSRGAYGDYYEGHARLKGGY